MATHHKDDEPSNYPLKVWQTIAIVALFVVVLLVVRVAFNVLLMALAGALIAIYFHGLGDSIQRWTKLKRTPAMIISIAGSFLLLGVMLWFMGTKIAVQIDQLSNTLPATINTAKEKLGETMLGKKMLDSFSGTHSESLVSTAQSMFTTGFGVLGNMYIILFLGLFFTANPSLYKDGLLLLVPQRKKPVGKHIINRISLSLKGWLKGMLISMLMITVLIAVGLSIIGVPVALVLALITGILELVPNLGSLIAMIPGVLLALTMGTTTAIIVAVLYIVAQTLVANIATPLLQKKMINLPPAVTLISQLIMGAVSGALGIILAVPLLAIVIILVDELYVKKIAPVDDNPGRGVLK